LSCRRCDDDGSDVTLLVASSARNRELIAGVIARRPVRATVMFGVGGVLAGWSPTSSSALRRSTRHGQ
jgi:hypothetical protein